MPLQKLCRPGRNWYWQCIHVMLNWAGEGKLRCPYCPFTTVYRWNHKGHVALHLGKSLVIQCPHCDFSCTGQSEYRLHYALHTGEKRHKCPFCDFNTSHTGNLKRHLSVHTGKWYDMILVGYFFACGIICTKCGVIPRERHAECRPPSLKSLPNKFLVLKDAWCF